MSPRTERSYLRKLQAELAGLDLPWEFILNRARDRGTSFDEALCLTLWEFHALKGKPRRCEADWLAIVLREIGRLPPAVVERLGGNTHETLHPRTRGALQRAGEVAIRILTATGPLDLTATSFAAAAKELARHLQLEPERRGRLIRSSHLPGVYHFGSPVLGQGYFHLVVHPEPPSPPCRPGRCRFLAHGRSAKPGWVLSRCKVCAQERLFTPLLDEPRVWRISYLVPPSAPRIEP